MTGPEYSRFVIANPEFDLPRFHTLTPEFEERLGGLTPDELRAWLTEQALLDRLHIAIQEIRDVPF